MLLEGYGSFGSHFDNGDEVDALAITICNILGSNNRISCRSYCNVECDDRKENK